MTGKEIKLFFQINLQGKFENEFFRIFSQNESDYLLISITKKDEISCQELGIGQKA